MALLHQRVPPLDFLKSLMFFEKRASIDLSLQNLILAHCVAIGESLTEVLRDWTDIWTERRVC